MSRFQDLIQRGTRAGQPAGTAVPVGTLYYVTDEFVTERSNGTTWDAYSAAVGIGDVIGPASSIASEAALFDGTSGKLIKRATGTGIVHRTSGVDSTSNVVESEITLADNTTNNVSTSAHGFTPKAPNDATKFLNGANPPAWTVPTGAGDVVGPASSVASEAVLFDGTSGKLVKRATGTGIVHRTSGVDSVSNVVESEITLADNTTNNVTTSAHGFAPKAPGVATQFLNGASPPAFAALPAINANAASIATGETQASNTTFGNLTTTGPAVTLTTGTAVIVWVSGNVTHGASGNSANVSVDVSGATTIAANGANSANISSAGASFDNTFSRCLTITGLTPGSNVFTLKYQNNGGGTWTFYNRSIAVLAL
jgi:hypothetical protein